ncbi:MAG: MarR family transcriptional regulator [Anaerolineaceae bacterium]|jgi:DNA-binding MarR family transcriptional regulator
MKAENKYILAEFQLIHRLIKIKSRLVFDNLGVPKINQPLILAILNQPENDGQIDTQKEIADKLNESQATIAQAIKIMQRAGLVKKIAQENDLRVNQIVITEKGKQLQKKFDDGYRYIQESMLQDFSENEQAQLQTFFIRILDNLENMSPKALDSISGRNIVD